MSHRTLACLVASLILAGCSWETYQNEQGKTSLRPKYEAGTRVYYEDGSYSSNMRYNEHRPEPHVLKPNSGGAHDDVGGTTWQAPAGK